MRKVWIVQAGLRAEGVVIREHAVDVGWFLVRVPGGEHWFAPGEIEWNRT